MTATGLMEKSIKRKGAEVAMDAKTLLIESWIVCVLRVLGVFALISCFSAYIGFGVTVLPNPFRGF